MFGTSRPRSYRVLPGHDSSALPGRSNRKNSGNIVLKTCFYLKAVSRRVRAQGQYGLWKLGTGPASRAGMGLGPGPRRIWAQGMYGLWELGAVQIAKSKLKIHSKIKTQSTDLATHQSPPCQSRHPPISTMPISIIVNTHADLVKTHADLHCHQNPQPTIIKTHDPPSSKPTLTHAYVNHKPTTTR